MEFLAAVRERRRILGIVDIEESVAAMRNSGLGRTPEKIELLRRIEERRKPMSAEKAPG